MHFSDELADPNELKLPADREVGKKEFAMAEQLINTMTDKWEPEKWKDEYRKALMKLIEEKVAAGGKEVPAPKVGARKPTNVVDLVSVLQQSLNTHAKGAGKKRKATAHSAHRKAA
jgi:DNA end-binding protein Ku